MLIYVGIHVVPFEFEDIRSVHSAPDAALANEDVDVVEVWNLNGDFVKRFSPVEVAEHRRKLKHNV